VPGVVAEATGGKQELGWATGLDDVDHHLSGLRPGELVIVAARPSLGKTAFAAQVALNCAKDGASVLFLSLEMSTSSLAQRMIANLGSIPFTAIRSGRLLPEELGRFHEAAQELGALKIGLIEDNGTTVSRLRGMARRRAANVGLDLIVVDYLQLMSHPSAKDRLQEVSAISRSLKSLARELRVPVLAVSQLSRAGSEGRPKLHHLRETGSLEQDADVVVMLWDDGKGGPLRCSVEKNRHGSTGDMNLFFNKPSLKIAGLAFDRGVPLK
jgi:replicative DNA helicase